MDDDPNLPALGPHEAAERIRAISARLDPLANVTRADIRKELDALADEIDPPAPALDAETPPATAVDAQSESEQPSI